MTATTIKAQVQLWFLKYPNSALSQIWDGTASWARNRSEDRLKYLSLLFEELHSRNTSCKRSSSRHSFCYHTLVFMGPSPILLWSGHNKEDGERIHLSRVWQSRFGCETLSQLKGLSPVSTLWCLYSLIQRVETGWHKELQPHTP